MVHVQIPMDASEFAASGKTASPRWGARWAHSSAVPCVHTRLMTGEGLGVLSLSSRCSTSLLTRRNFLKWIVGLARPASFRPLVHSQRPIFEVSPRSRNRVEIITRRLRNYRASLRHSVPRRGYARREKNFREYSQSKIRTVINF